MTLLWQGPSNLGVPPAAAPSICWRRSTIGKIGIPDTILGKPSKLTKEEFALMRGHVTIGARILENGSSNVIRTAELIAQSHHERWHGKGYRDQLSGIDVPVEAPVVTIADVFDALCAERPYEAAWPIEKARPEILASSGAHFDPACVAASTPNGRRSSPHGHFGRTRAHQL